MDGSIATRLHELADVEIDLEPPAPLAHVAEQQQRDVPMMQHQERKRIAPV